MADRRISRCHNFIAYTTIVDENSARSLYLVVDLTDTGLTIKRANILDDLYQQVGVIPVDINVDELKVNIKWERQAAKLPSTKLALVIPVLDMVMIYDIRQDKQIGPMVIPQSPSEGIQRVQWIPAPSIQGEVCDSLGDGAYENCKQLLVFTKQALSAKLYSLDSEHLLLEILKPQCGKAFFKAPDYRVWLVISRTEEYDSSPVISHFLNAGSVSLLMLQQRLQFPLILALPQVSWSPQGLWFSVFSDGESVAGYQLQVEGAVNLESESGNLTPLLHISADNTKQNYETVSSKYITTWSLPLHCLPGSSSFQVVDDKKSAGEVTCTEAPGSSGESEKEQSLAECFFIVGVCDRKRVLRITRISTHNPRLPRVFTIDVKSMHNCLSLYQRNTQKGIVYSTNSYVSSELGSPVSMVAADDVLCIRLETGIFILRKSGESGYRTSALFVPTLKIQNMEVISVASRNCLLVVCVDHLVLFDLYTLRTRTFMEGDEIFHAEIGVNQHAGQIVVYTSRGVDFCSLASGEEAEEGFAISRFKRRFDHTSTSMDITDTFGRKKTK